MTNDEWLKFVVQLHRETLAGQVEWHRRPEPEDLPLFEDSRVNEFYGANYRGRNLGIALVARRVWHDADEWHWEATPMLSFCDESWSFQASAPVTAGLEDLLESVRLQAAGVEDFVRQVLVGAAQPA